VRMRKRRGITLVEVFVAMLFFVILAFFIHSLLTMSARRNVAGDKKNQTVRAAFDVTGRIRRDLKWAVAVAVEDDGKRLVLRGAGGATRTYAYDKGTRRLQVPQIGKPGTSVPYRLATFRTVRFWRISGATVVKYVVSVLPLDANPMGPSANDLKYSTTVSGEVGIRREQGMGHFPDWNWGAECLN